MRLWFAIAALLLVSSGTVACGASGAATHAGPPPDPAAIERDLHHRVNTMRASDGMAPLDNHPGLRAIALSHSIEMRDRGFMGHDSPTTGTPADRVAGAGLGRGLVLENVASAVDADTLLNLLTSSVAHRANLLNNDVTHTGIGIVMQPRSAGGRLIATQVFARLPESIDVTAAPNQVLTGLSFARRARGAVPLHADRELSAMAQRGANAFFRQPLPTQRQVVDAVTAEFGELPSRYARLSTFMVVVPRLEDAFALEQALDPTVAVVGIGVAQGDRPDTGARAIAVVIALAWPR
jgi:uncharacterized protein YkwD